MGAATHPITDAIWREALAPELALTVSEWRYRSRQAPGPGAVALARVVVARAVVKYFLKDQ